MQTTQTHYDHDIPIGRDYTDSYRLELLAYKTYKLRHEDIDLGSLQFTYGYEHPNGDLGYLIARWQPPDGEKKITQHRPDPKRAGKPIADLGRFTDEPLIFNLPEVERAILTVGI